MESMNIKEVSKQVGIAPSTLRYYEQQALITPLRGDNNYRHYTQEHIRIIKYLSVMKYAGMSVKEMKVLSDLLARPTSDACRAETKDALDDIGAKISAKIEHLNTIKAVFDSYQTLYKGNSPEVVVSSSDALIDQLFDEIAEGVL